jgi:hypothetical protein
VKQEDFLITDQHEIEHPATDVVEAIVWKLCAKNGKAVSLTDIGDLCLILDYGKVHQATRNLVSTGRLIAAPRQRNERPMGPKWVTKYKSVPSLTPRLLENISKKELEYVG